MSYHIEVDLRATSVIVIKTFYFYTNLILQLNFMSNFIFLLIKNQVLSHSTILIYLKIRFNLTYCTFFYVLIFAARTYVLNDIVC